MVKDVVDSLPLDISKQNQSSNKLIDIYLGYYCSWKNLNNLRVLNHIVKEKGSWKRALNYSIADLYNNFKNASCIKSYLRNIFELYYNGYIIYNDMLRNIFLGNLRAYAYLKSVDYEEAEVEALLNSVYDTELLYRPAYRELVIDGFRALVSFCDEKLEESLLAEDETDLFLAHAKLNGMTSLIRFLVASFEFLSSNTVFQFQRDFYEEIDCDCGAIRLQIYSDFEAVNYTHWLLTMFLNNSIAQPPGFFELCAKERIFLSLRVKQYLETVEINKENIQSILNYIRKYFRTLDYRVIQPLSIVKNINYYFLRLHLFDSDKFYEKFRNFADIDEDAYKLYSDKWKTIENEGLRDIVTKTHNGLCLDELRSCIKLSVEGGDPMAIFDLIFFTESLYPANFSAKHELAIILDRTGNHQQAMDKIEEAILLDFDNPLLWQSLSVIAGNLAQPAESGLSLYFAKQIV
jgi:hypothetical protein